MKNAAVPIGCLVIVCLGWVAPSSVAADSWPQFRGPSGNGIADEASLPIEWGPNKNIAWKVTVPGVAWSQPITWGDRIYVTTAITENQTKPNGAMMGRGPGGQGPNGAEKGDGKRGEGKGRRGRPDGGFGPDGKGKGEGKRGGRPGGYGRSAPESVYRWEIHCLDKKSGEKIWSQVADEHKPAIPTHRTNTYASETPVTDGERVYAYFGMTGLFCYDKDGKLLWKKDVGAYPMFSGWGTGSSPILFDDLLILQCDNEKSSFLVAFDKKTGQEKWRDKRDEGSTWSTPYLWKNKLRTELVTGGSKKARSYDPATGKLLWELGGISGRSAATPVGDDEMIFFGTGGVGPGPLIAMRVGASGNLMLDANQKSSKEGHIAWVSPRGGPPMSSPLLYKGLLYVLQQRSGPLTCYHAKTGEVAFQERIPGATGFTASPWAADGKIYCLDGEGTTFVLEAGPKFKLIAKNPMKEMCWSSPALSGGEVVLRTVDHLYCIRQ